jgi:hypothetical protein
MAASNPLVVGLEQGVVAILGSKGSAALLQFSRPHELLLTSCSLLAVLHAARSLQGATRVTAILAQVVQTVALNTALQWAAVGNDRLLVAAQLLAVFFWGQALQQAGGELMGLTAQYLLVSRLSATLHHREYLPVAWLLAFAPSRVFPPDLAQIGQLVAVESLSAWLSDWLPRDLLLLSTAILLYLCAPLSQDFPALNRLYRFAVFAFSNDTQLAGVPAWLLAAGLWALWQAEGSSVGKRLAAVAGSNMAVLAALDSLRFAMDDDPAPTLVALLTVIRILEESQTDKHIP